MDPRTVGILGGGQLGRMLLEAAHRLNINVLVLDGEHAPAKQINGPHGHVTGSFTDPTSIRALAARCDLLTVEIEHVNTQVLEEIAEQGVEVAEQGQAPRRRVVVQPSWRTLRVIQDKYRQKEHLQSRDIQTAESWPLPSNDLDVLAQVVQQSGLPCMLKSRTQAYDGRGNYPIKQMDDLPRALKALGARPLYVERWAHFQAELAVMVVKIQDTAAEAHTDTWKESTLAYPTAETIHERSICKLVYAPARGLSARVASHAQRLARRAVAGFSGCGVFGVEMFLLDDGELTNTAGQGSATWIRAANEIMSDTLLVNEIAPRPHNSGHYTIEACAVSQYDAHLRAILGLPFPPAAAHETAGMGGSSAGTQMMTPDTHAIMLNMLGGDKPDTHLSICRRALATAGASVHLYGKGAARPGRKMGHITIVAETMATAEGYMAPLLAAEDMDGAPATGQVRGRSDHVEKPSKGAAVVAVTMGSDSDLPVLQPGIALLYVLGIPFEVTITSAHRTPERMYRFAREAASRGIKVIIAAAGGAAHLPGMIAASTPLPVIGIPVKASSLDGLDSLLSIVQMPRGVPVATVSINNSVNAALLAGRILGTSDVRIRQRVEAYAAEMEGNVLDKVEQLERDGWDQHGGVR
ncbi:MAG: phosphoribosylaminoimidazole carboxylase ade2 [Thelocarpon superellum]|nr:MAG: phosphoribosylaminoimidazole carboxylase ade2 [Thelocarpon superellum]